MADVDNGSDVKSEGATGASAKTRSETPYPYFGLGHAIKLVEAVRRAGGNEASSADVMREMGIEKVTDRPWSYGVPSAVLFGLVERLGRGEVGRIKVTELGLRIALPGPGEEERAAKIAAFRTPALYVKLLERYAGADVPPKEGLKNILFRDYGIVESMTTYAADAFIDSLTVAGLVTPGNKIMFGGSPTPGDKPPPLPPEGAGDPPAPKGTKPVYVPENFVIYKCKISKGRVIDIPLPANFTKPDVERLYAFLQTQVDDEPTGEGGS